MKIYLAARYSRREELCGYRDELTKSGHTVQARWLNSGNQLSDDGICIGEQGEAIVEDRYQTTEGARLRERFALDDWEDVSAAECVISFTEPPRSKANRGGRHVEYGIALARGVRVIVVGYRENIFHWLPVVEFCETWEKAKALLVTVVTDGRCKHGKRPENPCWECDEECAELQAMRDALRKSQPSDAGFRYLKEGEIIEKDDYFMDDSGMWRNTVCAGECAPNPDYTPHRKYRRYTK